MGILRDFRACPLEWRINVSAAILVFLSAALIGPLLNAAQGERGDQIVICSGSQILIVSLTDGDVAVADVVSSAECPLTVVALALASNVTLGLRIPRAELVKWRVDKSAPVATSLATSHLPRAPPNLS